MLGITLFRLPLRLLHSQLHLICTSGPEVLCPSGSHEWMRCGVASLGGLRSPRGEASSRHTCRTLFSHLHLVTCLFSTSQDRRVILRYRSAASSPQLLLRSLLIPLTLKFKLGSEVQFRASPHSFILLALATSFEVLLFRCLFKQSARLLTQPFVF